MGVINEVSATQELRLALALGHRGISPLRIDVASCRHVVRDSIRFNSHEIMRSDWSSDVCSSDLTMVS